MKSEKDVKQRVKKLLDQHNYFWFMPPANGYGKAGISDILALRGGIFLAIETKFGTNKPSPLQIGFLNSIGAEQGFAFVVSDRNISFFENWLTAFDKAVEAKMKNEELDPAYGAMMFNALKVLTEPLA